MPNWNRQKTLALLRQYECRNITYIDPDGSWPIVWKRARGVFVWDSAGKKYLDLTAGFGVAATGHANLRVVRAGRQQMGELLHAMGDVHPHALKARLARELSRLTFERWGRSAASAQRTGLRGKAIFCNSGFEAVEASLKSALLATGKPGVIAFHGAYHGTGYGALNTTHRRHFRSPFLSQLGRFGSFVEFPKSEDRLDAVKSTLQSLLRRRSIGAILVEPIQGRGGINVPPPAFLPLLRRLCDQFGALLILDEIYTGFGRTGRWFACEHSRTVPDLICLGKALSGGFPISACVGRADLMDAAWPSSNGEAIHTSTFLGHPVGCAMALAQIQEIRQRHLVKESAELGKVLLETLARVKSTPRLLLSARGAGLMAGLELRLPKGRPATARTLQTIKGMLQKGFVLLPEGEHANVISFTPPLIISPAQLEHTVDALNAILRGI
ncbi:MAG: aspartate aminotransferase family protein [Verrucomicrobia bacterium]|nr:aspartate aminotransferase family protein [Verrucomicrobiota bacterium]